MSVKDFPRLLLTLALMLTSLFVFADSGYSQDSGSSNGSSVLMSYAEDVMHVTVSASDGEVSGHEYVDLGLPSGTLWAAANLGSESRNDPGACFSWGETEPRETFLYDNYKFFEKVEFLEDGRCRYEFSYIGDDICGTEYDAAYVHWGDGWRLPNAEEFYELVNCCQTKHIRINMTDGVLVCGPNGNSIFLPMVYCDNGAVSLAVIKGSYWTGSLADEEPSMGATDAMSFHFFYDDIESGKTVRWHGQAIRPVVSKKGLEAAVRPISIEDASVSKDDGVAPIYDMMGRRIAHPVPGQLYIQAGKKHMAPK